jgi:hypothetical protein
VRGGPCLAHDADVDQFFRQDGIGRLEDDIDRQVVDPARFEHAPQLESALRILGQRALDGEHDVVRGKRRAVVEFDVGPKLETPALGIDRLPRHG